MGKKQTTGHQTIALALVAGAMVSGCGSADWIKDRITSGSTDETEVLGAPPAERYLAELGLVASGSATAAEEAFADASAVANLTPGPSADLRLGLVLAVPGHAHSDAARASQLLRGVLGQTELLTQSEISLAQIMLASAERQAGAEAETSRLRTSSSQSLESQEQQAAARIAAAEAENRRLRAELAEANEKLDALTSIERDIRER